MPSFQHLGLAAQWFSDCSTTHSVPTWARSLEHAKHSSKTASPRWMTGENLNMREKKRVTNRKLRQGDGLKPSHIHKHAKFSCDNYSNYKAEIFRMYSFKTPTAYYLWEIVFKLKTYICIKRKKWKYIYYKNTNQKKTGMIQLIPVRGDFKTKHSPRQGKTFHNNKTATPFFQKTEILNR